MHPLTPYKPWWQRLLNRIFRRRDRYAELSEAPAAPPAPNAPVALSQISETPKAEPSSPGSDPITEQRELLRQRLELLHESARLDMDKALIIALLEAVSNQELELPRVPIIAHELLALDPNTSALCNHEVAELIGKDQELVTEVMRIANSPTYSVVPVTSIDRAVSQLGLLMVRQVATGAALQRGIYRVPGYQALADQERLHGQRAAAIASQLACRMGDPSLMGPAWLGGLFHDVGKVLILRNLSQLRARTRGGTASQLLIRHLMRELHVPLGRYFALVRGLPREIDVAIGGHHDISAIPPEYRSLAWLIAAADLVDEQPSGTFDLVNLAATVSWPEHAPSLSEVLRCARALAVTDESIAPKASPRPPKMRASA